MGLVTLATFSLADTECVGRECSIGVSIKVEAAGFSGSVRDLSGLIPDVSVIAVGTNHSTVSASGNYNLLGLSAGFYDLKASADGYLSQTKSNELAVVNQIITADFALSQTGRIKGKVVDFFTSSSIENANLTLSLYWEDIGSTLTDSNGLYELSNLAPGYYNINVKAGSYTENSKPNNQVLGGQNTTVNFWLW